MQLPDWLHVCRIRRSDPRTLQVTFHADVTRYVQAMAAVAAEQEAIARYHRRIQHERSLAQAYVNCRLDKLCYDLGLDPVQTWRLPKAQEERDRLDRAAFRAAQYYGDAVEARAQAVISGSVA